MGFIYKSLFMLEAGIKPIWIFDGVAPEQKKHELKKRRELKAKAKIAEDEVKDLGDAEEQRKYAVRGIKVTSGMTDDSIKLLQLMGMPVFRAASEAEAQCVELLKAGKVAAVVSDDMDCLTFGCSMLLKGVKSKTEPVQEITLEAVLKGLELNMEEFIDFCILCGCDYLPTIHGFGPVTAHKQILKHRSIEKVFEAIIAENKEAEAKGEKPRYEIPSLEDYDYVTARELFKKPELANLNELIDDKVKVSPPDEDNLTAFMSDKGFALDRIAGVIKRLKESGKQKPQMSLESYFGKPLKKPDDKPKNKSNAKQTTPAKRNKAK